ncbi:uncharacterized protein AMSG_01246 [Thecamonas trahens ATCC 50062]|uniref:Uncharacterized protein n=1 Tax=Thecamonas trahens ATCC 50062 TaxID=461836 RepID=A0A0L0DQ30_THETB|nr:hypothetical protein AMSG_01246 [Thecamonas trahens ATCC 50062]KNC53533.1 hypothetical protein AMSG_01246 [Thecamonas trahens ATCC 50062]|eukprot:XP_013761854.1 hypothetical protein AMSG_01246 [Thecamonas trahens ATCC 50062]
MDSLLHVRLQVRRTTSLSHNAARFKGFPASPCVYVVVRYCDNAVTRTNKLSTSLPVWLDTASAASAASVSKRHPAVASFMAHSTDAPLAFELDVVLARAECAVGDLVPGAECSLPLVSLLPPASNAESALGGPAANLVADLIVFVVPSNDAVMTPLDAEELDAISTTDLFASGAAVQTARAAAHVRIKASAAAAASSFDGSPQKLPPPLRARLDQVFDMLAGGSSSFKLKHALTYMRHASAVSSLHASVPAESAAAGLMAYFGVRSSRGKVSRGKWLEGLCKASIGASIDDTGVAKGLSWFNVFFPLPPPTQPPSDPGPDSGSRERAPSSSSSSSSSTSSSSSASSSPASSSPASSSQAGAAAAAVAAIPHEPDSGFASASSPAQSSSDSASAISSSSDTWELDS